jgi:phosphatidyl-myo-inositol dimannoside synthase
MPVVVLTPNLTGCDGISHLSRLVVRACGACGDVRVIALHEPMSVRRFEGIDVSSAGGRNARFAALALQHAAAAGAATSVVVVHLHLAPGALAFAARGAALTTFLCGIEAWVPLNWAQRALLLRSAPVLAISAHTRSRFRAANPRLSGLGVAICHPGIGAGAPGGSAEHPAAARPVALIVGRMAAGERYKGHDALLEIWRDVAARVPGAMLEIAGDGDDRLRLEAKASSLGLNGSVVFLGRVDDDELRRRYRQCTVLAMPSRDEGFGLVFLEAMRAGRPVIAAHGAASEIVDDGRTGLLVQPGDRRELTDALVSLLDNPRRAAAMGAAARARLIAHFTEEQFRSRLAAAAPRIAAPPVPA